MIKRLTFIFLLLAGTVNADALVTVTRMSADSANNTDLNNLSIPRWQMAATTRGGQLVWYVPPVNGESWYPAADVKFLIGRGLLTASPVWSRYTETGYATSPSPADHLHLHSYKDTLYASKFGDRAGRAFFVDTTNSTITRLFNWTNPLSETDQMVVAAYPLPGSDTVIRISRSTGDPANTNNIRLWYSTDNGQTYGSASYVRDWSTYAGRKRIGLFPYGNSVGLVADSGDAAIVVSVFNRATASWESWGSGTGSAIAITSDGYRTFSASTVEDTTIVTAFCKVNVDGAGSDSILTAYRNNGSTSWTRLPALYVGSGDLGAYAPYMQFTYIESSKRLVMFYTKNFTGSINSFDIFCRYLKMPERQWSQEYQVTNEGARGEQSFKLTAAPIIPTKHGDVAYVGYTYADATNGYNKARLAVVRFSDYASTINITSLPYTISQSNTAYTIDGVKLTSQTNGITIATGVHNILIDGQQDTIEFDLAGATVGSSYTLVNSNNGNKGIIIGASCYNVTIKDLVIKHNPPSNIRTDSTLISNAVGIRWAAGGGTHDILIEGCHISIAPVRNAWAIVMNNSGSAHYNNIIRNNTIRDSCNAFARRDYWEEQTAICLLQFVYGASAVPVADRANFRYHLWLFGNDVQAFWANLFIEGDSSVVIVEQNTFQTDGWNRLSGTPYDDAMNAIRGFDGVNCTENYCISIKDRDSRTDAIRVQIIDNDFNAGVNHAGGRGIFTAGARGRSWAYDDHIYIARNTFTVHQGEDGAGDNCMGFIARQGFGYITFRDNVVTVVGDNDPFTTAYGKQLIPVRLTTAPTAANIRVIKNTITSYFNGTPPTQNWRYAAGDAGSYGIMFDEADDNKTNWTIDSNTTSVQGVHLQYGWYNGPSGACRVTNHTFGYPLGTNPNNSTTWLAHQGDAEPERTAEYIPYITSCLGNEIVDPIFINGTTDNRVFLEDNGTFPQASVKIAATFTVTVRNSSNQPVSGAAVTITNGYGSTQASGLTNGSGVYTAELPYWYEENVAAGNNDSTGWNPYVVQASYLSAGTATTNHTLTATNKAVTLYLGSTPETPAEPRTKITGGVHISGGVIIP